MKKNKNVAVLADTWLIDKKLAGEGVTVTLGADCNRDGNYNADDLIPLKKYLLGVNGVHFGK